MKINIEDIEKNIEFRRSLNRVPVEEIKFYKNGKQFIIPENLIEEFKFTGLNNMNIVIFCPEMIENEIDNPINDLDSSENLKEITEIAKELKESDDLPDSYWEKEERLLAKRNKENKELRKSMIMSPEKMQKRFDI